MPNNNIINERVAVEKEWAFDNLGGGFGDFVPFFMAIEKRFKGESAEEKVELSHKMETGQGNVDWLNNLYHLINYGTKTEAGFTTPDKLRQDIGEIISAPSLEAHYDKRKFDSFLDHLEEESCPLTEAQKAFLKEKNFVKGEEPTKPDMDSLLTEATKKENSGLATFLKEKGILRFHKKAELPQALKETGMFQTQYDKDVFNQMLDGENEGNPLSREEIAKIVAIGIEEGVQPSEEQMDELLTVATLKESENIRKFLWEKEIIYLPEKFTPQEINWVKTNITSSLKSREAINTRGFQELQNLESKIDKIYQALNAIAKKLDDILMKIASKINGR